MRCKFAKKISYHEKNYNNDGIGHSEKVRQILRVSKISTDGGLVPEKVLSKGLLFLI